MAIESSRRKKARVDLGFESEEQKSEIQEIIAKEEARRSKKSLVRQNLEEDFSYRCVKGISFVMDKCFLDAVVGIWPGVGDVLTTVLSLPSIYVSVFKIKSLPLTLAVLYNIVLDCFIGLTPFVGDILDILYRSYSKNYRLIVGFVEDDKEIVTEVRRSAWKSAILIVVLLVLCVVVYQLVKGMYLSIFAMFAEWFG
jgi:hypothetical protein